jgi:WD repeat-containing protein 45
VKFVFFVWLSDHLPKEIGELSFRQVVLRIKLRKDAIAVALRDRVYVYHLADLSLRDKIYTADNPHGLLCLSTQIQNMVLACPSVSLGHVRVELYGLRKTQVRKPHTPPFWMRRDP